MFRRALVVFITVLLGWSERAAAYEPPPPATQTRPYDAKLPSGITLKFPPAGLRFVADQLQGGLQQSALRTTIAEALEGQYFEIIFPIFGGNLRLTIPCGEDSRFGDDLYFDNKYLVYRPWCPYIRGDAQMAGQGALPPVTTGNDRGFRYQRVAVDVSTYPVAGLNTPKPNSLFAALYLLENGGLKAQLDMVPEHALFKVQVPALVAGPGGTFEVAYQCFNLLGDGAGCESTFVATLEADLVTGGEIRPYFENNTLYVLVTDFETRIGALKILSPLTQNTALLAALDACIAAGAPGVSDGCTDQKAQINLLYQMLEQALGDAALQFFERELNAALSDVLQDGINQLLFDRGKDGSPDPVIALNRLVEGLNEDGVNVGFNFDARYKSNATDPTEAYFILDGGLYAGAFSSCVNAAAQPGFPFTELEADGNVGHDPPRLADLIPGTAFPYQIGISISDDFVNQTVWNMWAVGLLCAVVSPRDPALPKDVADLLVTESFAPFIPWLPELAPKAPVLIQVTPRRPPYVTFGDAGDGSLFRLTLPEVLLDVFVEVGESERRAVRAFGIDAAVTVAVDVKAINFDKAPLFDISVQFESTSAMAFNDLRPDSNADIEKIIPPVLDLLAPAVAEFVGDLEIPLVSDCFGGVRQRDLVLRTSGTDPVSGIDNYLDIYLNFSGLLDFNKIITECAVALSNAAPREVVVTHELGLVAANPPALDAAAYGIDTARPYRRRIDGGFWWPARAGELPPRAMLDGAHTVELEQDGVVSRLRFDLDSAAPIVRFAQKGERVVIDVVDIGATLTRVDGGAPSAATRFERRLAPGRHTVRVVSRDAAGHETAVAKAFTVEERAGCASASPAGWLAGLVAGFALLRRRAVR